MLYFKNNHYVEKAKQAVILNLFVEIFNILVIVMSFWLGKKFKKMAEGRELHCKCYNA